ncbi:MAG: FtsX-like permease family protein [Luteitalea sp.]|nr:FtsX-like permease family protein [Luteitalea sp.]
MGVVEDVRQFGLNRVPEPQFFADLRQWPGSGPLFPIGAYYTVRTDGDSTAIISSLRGIVHELDAQAALFNVAAMEQLVATTIARPRVYAVLLGTFAAVAVALAASGVFGIIAYSVTQRTREIGIRIALGAQRSNVMGLVLRQSTILATIGMTLGLAASAALTRSLEGMLFGLTPLDPTTLVAVSLIFGLVATLAAFVPARRATRVDPLVALRHE